MQCKIVGTKDQFFHLKSSELQEQPSFSVLRTD